MVTRTCTVVSSEAGPLPIDTQAVYTLAVPELDPRLSATVVLTTPGGGGTTTGHCTLSFRSFVGRCVFARGTGDLAGFHANLDVTLDPASGITTWDGTYHFAGRD